MHDVFISYSTKDHAQAYAICAALETRGVRCWIAPRDIAAGANYPVSIVRAINAAKAMVLVFSSHSNKSPAVGNEVERAFSKRVPLIPVRIEDVAPSEELEFFLSTPQWVDATQALEERIDELAELVSAELLKHEPATDAGHGLMEEHAEPVAASAPVAVAEAPRPVAAVRVAPKAWTPAPEAAAVPPSISRLHDWRILAAVFVAAVVVGAVSHSVYASANPPTAASAAATPSAAPSVDPFASGDQLGSLLDGGSAAPSQSNEDADQAGGAKGNP